jgi:serine/threonine-protein kinase RsbW
MVENYEIFKINSETKNLIRIESFLNDYFKRNLLSNENFYKVYLCISEAVINSIFHGNNGDSGKLITIKIKKSKQHLFASVCDEGIGFDYFSIEDPTKKENIKKEFGRGIFIIKSLTVSLKFIKNCCFLKFKI